MHKNSQLLTKLRSALGLLLWALLLPLQAQELTARLAAGQPLVLGPDLAMQAVMDPTDGWKPEDVEALPASVFQQWTDTLSMGYTRSPLWVRIDMPAALRQEAALQLQILPTYLDSVIVYQREGPAWVAQVNGDLVSASQRGGRRAFLFDVRPDRPLFLRVQTSSVLRLQGKLWRPEYLPGALERSGWAMGSLFGFTLGLLMLIWAAAVAFRMRQLAWIGLLGTVGLFHILNVHGYGIYWLLEEHPIWASHMVGVGAFALSGTTALLVREQLTRGTRWRRTDRFLLVLAALNLACMAAAPLGYYSELAILSVISPIVSSAIGATLFAVLLRQRRPTLERRLLFFTYAIHSVGDVLTLATFVGLLHVGQDLLPQLWQIQLLMFLVMVVGAVFTGMYQRYRSVHMARTRMLQRLTDSEHRLELRVQRRTRELDNARADLQDALHAERELRLEQRQFFSMISHEFRTPLAVVDSAATEQLAFPTPELPLQMERAAQIRRACHRLTALVENCLANERFASAGFRLMPGQVSVPDLVQDAAELVQWSPRHQLQIHTDGAPAHWPCDPTLVRIAFSNLVDNAVKYARGGTICVSAGVAPTGGLALSVANEGPGLAPDEVERIFGHFERGNRADEARGFGLGLWVSRRIAQLHGGDVTASSEAGHGARFTLTLAPTLPPQA